MTAAGDGDRRRGLITVYTGDGKGKTTAAFGAVFRALGRDMRAAVVQFIKGKRRTGERIQAARVPGVEVLVAGCGFTWNSDDLSRDADAARAGWRRAAELIAAGEHDLVVLDEITYACHYGFLDTAEVASALASRPGHVHVIVTGRNCPAELTELADLVTEMKPLKHPFDRGIPAQLGLDY